jgi:hypothetical protein
MIPTARVLAARMVGVPVFYLPSGSAVASACNGPRNRVPRDGKSGRNPLFRTFVGTHNTLHKWTSRLPVGLTAVPKFGPQVRIKMPIRKLSGRDVWRYWCEHTEIFVTGRIYAVGYLNVGTGENGPPCRVLLCTIWKGPAPPEVFVGSWELHRKRSFQSNCRVLYLHSVPFSRVSLRCMMINCRLYVPFLVPEEGAPGFCGIARPPLRFRSAGA